MFKHPEIKNNGLECDIDLWVEFNKELAILTLMNTEELQYDRDLNLLVESYYYNFERKQYVKMVERCRELGYLKFNYLPADEDEELAG